MTQYRFIPIVNHFLQKVGNVSTRIQALELWRHTLVASVRGDEPDLSARQMAVLLSVYMEDKAHTVRGLAKALRISKPAISRALDRLGELDYIRRERDELDRRNVLVRRTGSGASFLHNFSGLISAARDYAATLPDQEVDFGVEIADTAPSTPETLIEPQPAYADVAA